MVVRYLKMTDTIHTQLRYFVVNNVFTSIGIQIKYTI